MSFSASPLIPGQRSGDADTWAQLAQLTVAAVTQALTQIPSAGPLEPGEAGQDLTTATPPDPAGAAVLAALSGGVEGSVLLIVGTDLVEALQGTPYGDLEPAKAMKPARESIATALGARLDGEPTGVEPGDALSVLTAGTPVVLPLTSGGTVSALVGVSFQSMPEAGGAPSGTIASRTWGIEMLRDVEMEVTCELGRTRMAVRQLLALAPGDVVELDRLAGSPADLLVNGTLLARGEVVVVDEAFGLRITEIVTRDAQ